MQSSMKVSMMTPEENTEYILRQFFLHQTTICEKKKSTTLLREEVTIILRIAEEVEKKHGEHLDKMKAEFTAYYVTDYETLLQSFQAAIENVLLDGENVNWRRVTIAIVYALKYIKTDIMLIDDIASYLAFESPLFRWLDIEKVGGWNEFIRLFKKMRNILYCIYTYFVCK